MAKSKPMIPAKARPVNLVMRNPKSEEDSSQSLGYLVNRVNAYEQKVVEIAAGNSWRSASRSEVGCSQVSRQGIAPLATGNSWQRSSSKDNVMRKHFLTTIAQGSLCRVRIQNQSIKTWDTRTINTWPRSFISCNRSWECQQDTQFSQWQHKKCIDIEYVHVFVDESSHLSWAELCSEFWDLQEHEIRWDWEFVEHHSKKW